MADPLGLLEVKCPASANDTLLKDLCHKSNFFLNFSDTNNFQLKTNHNYYYQVQGQMHITKRAWCDFVVWSPCETNLHVERILYKPQIWEKTMYPKLEQFYFGSMLPELASPRYPSSKKVRDTIEIGTHAKVRT